MRVHKDVDDKELLIQAEEVLSKLRANDRVFGNPAEGLKKTLRNVEDKLEEDEKNKSVLDVVDDNAELISQRRKLKAGIRGEEDLAEFIENMIRVKPELHDCICFASLSDPDQNSGGDDYISDSDFLLVYGNNILIVDAKNVRTNPDIPLYVKDNMLMSASQQEILEIHPSTYIWQKVFDKYDCHVDSISGCIVIVNNSGALIWKNSEWFNSSAQPMHIQDFPQYVEDWIQGKEDTVSLKTLAVIAHTQIRKDNDVKGLDYLKRSFKL